MPCIDVHSFEDVGGNPFSGLGLGFDTKTHFLKASFPLLTSLETVFMNIAVLGGQAIVDPIKFHCTFYLTVRKLCVMIS